MPQSVWTGVTPPPLGKCPNPSRKKCLEQFGFGLDPPPLWTMSKSKQIFFRDSFPYLCSVQPRSCGPDSPNRDELPGGRTTETKEEFNSSPTWGKTIPPIWFGLAFLRIRLPCSGPTTDDLNSRVEFAGGTYSLLSRTNAVSF